MNAKTSLTLLIELIKDLGRDVTAQAERIDVLRAEGLAEELAEEEARLLRLADAQRRAFARIAHTIAQT
jgi:hypothetical protein